MLQSFINEFGTIASFSYKIDTLISDLIEESSMKAKGISDNPEMFDKLRLSEDERGWIDKTLPKACNDVYRVVQRFSKKFTEAYKYNTEVQDDDGNALGLHVVYSMVLGDNFDVNVLYIADEQMHRAIIANVLQRWYKLVGRPDLEGEYRNEFQENYDEAKSHLLASAAKPIRAKLPPFG